MDTKYNTILAEYENEIVEKKSRFICYLIPIKSEADAKQKIEAIKKQYYDARHHCSAYIIDHNPLIERGNDDGEPGGTAGMPMLEVLRGNDLRNVLAVVVRYFGGTLLGTGGLIRAYTNSVKRCLENATVVEKHLCEKIVVGTDYGNYGRIEYEIHRLGQRIVDTEYGEDIKLHIIVGLPILDKLVKSITEITSGQCNIEKSGLYYVMNGGRDIILEKVKDAKVDK